MVVIKGIAVIKTISKKKKKCKGKMVAWQITEERREAKGKG